LIVFRANPVLRTSSLIGTPPTKCGAPGVIVGDSGVLTGPAFRV
jgi:hypothetical protein